MNVYSIYDKKASAFYLPFFLANNFMAERAFQNQVADKETLIGKNPEDFVLYRLAEFDENTGSFDDIQPVVLMKGEEVR